MILTSGKKKRKGEGERERKRESERQREREGERERERENAWSVKCILPVLVMCIKLNSIALTQRM